MKSSNSEISVLKSGNENRIYYLDFARCLAMFLVIFAHCFVNSSDVRLYIYAFHMPFFFVVSGMLHKQGKQNLKRLLFPTLFFVLLFITLSIPLYQSGIWSFEELYSREKPDDWFSTLYMSIWFTVCGIIKGGKFANHYCWFLLVLCGCKLLMELYFFLKIKISYIYLFFMFVLFWSISMLFQIRILWIANVLMAFPFYYVGYYSKNIMGYFVKWKYHYIFFPMSLVMTILLTIINGRVSMMGCDFGITPNYLSPILFYLNGIIGSIMLFSISPSFEIKLCTKLSRSLISILGFQGLFIPFIIGKVSIIEALGMTFVLLVICYYLHYFTVKMLPIVYQQSN